MLAAQGPAHQPNGAAILSEQQRAAQLKLDLDLGVDMSKAAYGAGEGFSTAPTFESTEEILGDTLALHLKKCTEDSATPLPPKSLKLLPENLIGDMIIPAMNWLRLTLEDDNSLLVKHKALSTTRVIMEECEHFTAALQGGSQSYYQAGAFGREEARAMLETLKLLTTFEAPDDPEMGDQPVRMVREAAAKVLELATPVSPQSHVSKAKKLGGLLSPKAVKAALSPRAASVAKEAKAAGMRRIGSDENLRASLQAGGVKAASAAATSALSVGKAGAGIVKTGVTAVVQDAQGERGVRAAPTHRVDEFVDVGLVLAQTDASLERLIRGSHDGSDDSVRLHTQLTAAADAAVLKNASQMFDNVQEATADKEEKPTPAVLQGIKERLPRQSNHIQALTVEWLRRRTAHESTVVVHKSLMLLQIMLESHKALLLPKLLQNEAIISDLSFLTVCTLSLLSPFVPSTSLTACGVAQSYSVEDHPEAGALPAQMVRELSTAVLLMTAASPTSATKAKMAGSAALKRIRSSSSERGESADSSVSEDDPSGRGFDLSPMGLRSRGRGTLRSLSPRGGGGGGSLGEALGGFVPEHIARFREKRDASQERAQAAEAEPEPEAPVPDHVAQYRKKRDASLERAAAAEEAEQPAEEGVPPQ